MLRRSFFASLLVVFMVMIQGCMPVTKPFVPAKVQADKVLIYAYRPESFVARGSTWSLKVNDKVVSTYFINNGYIPIYAKPGNIHVELYHDNGFMTPNVYDKTVIAHTKAGDVYYLKAFMEFAGSPHFELMDKAVGEKEIKKALYFEDQMNKK